MSVIDYIKAVFFLAPWPLNKEWLEVGESRISSDSYAPVNFKGLSFEPEREIIRKHCKPDDIHTIIDQVQDYLVYMSFEDHNMVSGYYHLNESREKLYGDVKIEWREGKNNSNYLKFWCEIELDEGQDLQIRNALKKIFKSLGKKPFSMTLNFQIQTAHKDWQIPEKYSFYSSIEE